MVGNFISLYPQLAKQADRRTNSVIVEVERRSGMDRRHMTRTIVDPKIKRDIDLVKGFFSRLFGNATDSLSA